MPSKEQREKFENLRSFITSGNYKRAFEIFKRINPDELSKEERELYENYKKIFSIDVVYIISALCLFAIIITYFLLVK